MNSTKPIIVLNAFSVNQLETFPADIHIDHITLDEARIFIAHGYLSVVGHVATAAVFSEQLGVPIPYNRCTITLHPGEQALLGQYRGERLPEGATSLPEGSTIEWFIIHVL